MDSIVGSVAFVELECPEIVEGVVQLRINILPFAHPQVGKKALFAELPPLTLRREPIPFIVNGGPDIEQREKNQTSVDRRIACGGAAAAASFDPADVRADLECSIRRR